MIFNQRSNLDWLRKSHITLHYELTAWCRILHNLIYGIQKTWLNQKQNLYKHITCILRWNDVETVRLFYVYSTLKRRGKDRFHVISTWNTRGVFVGNSPSIQGHFTEISKKCTFSLKPSFNHEPFSWGWDREVSWYLNYACHKQPLAYVCKIDVPKNFAKVLGKQLCQKLFWKVTGF